MASLIFLDGLGNQREFEFNQYSSLYRFLIDTKEQIAVETLPQEQLTAIGLSSAIGLGNVKALNLNITLTNVGTSIDFNLNFSNDGGTVYKPFFASDIQWTTNQSETYTLDNTETAYTNLQVELININGGTPTLTIDTSVIR